MKCLPLVIMLGLSLFGRMADGFVSRTPEVGYGMLLPPHSCLEMLDRADIFEHDADLTEESAEGLDLQDDFGLESGDLDLDDETANAEELIDADFLEDSPALCIGAHWTTLRQAWQAAVARGLVAYRAAHSLLADAAQLVRATDNDEAFSEASWDGCPAESEFIAEADSRDDASASEYEPGIDSSEIVSNESAQSELSESAMETEGEFEEFVILHSAPRYGDEAGLWCSVSGDELRYWTNEYSESLSFAALAAEWMRWARGSVAHCTTAFCDILVKIANVNSDAALDAYGSMNDTPCEWDED